MTDNFDSKDRAEKPCWLPLDQVDPAELDYTELELYNEKSKFIEEQRVFPVSRCYLKDFLIQVFERSSTGFPLEEPFEEKGCERYQRWREEQNAGEPHRSYDDGQFVYNSIVFYKRPLGKVRNKKNGEKVSDMNVYHLLLKDDWDTKDWLESRKFALMAPITYVGKTTANKNARYLYAFTIDLDGVGIEQLQTLFLYLNRMMKGTSSIAGLPIIPLPNIIVNSGHGLHLYYTMKHPLALFEENAKILQLICKAMYYCVAYPVNEKNGEPGTTTMKKLQCLGIYHLFRLPETNTKALVHTKDGIPVGEGVPIQAWITEAGHYTINDLMPYIKWAGNGADKFLTPNVIHQLERGGRLLNPKRLTLKQAREKYGEKWYQNRDKPKGRYSVKRRLYDWWLKKMKDKAGVTEGHRYYCIMALTAFAVKCDIPFDELKRDAYSLIDSFDTLTSKSNNHFRKYDVDVALKAYQKPNTVRWSKNMIANWTDIPMKQTKRNKRKQEDHLKMMNFIRDTLSFPDGGWRNKDGRPIATPENSKECAIVTKWRQEHPDCTNKSLCAKETGLSRPTVRKWWNIEEVPKLSLRNIEKATAKLQKNSRLRGMLTVEELKQEVNAPNSKIERKIVIDMAKLFAPESNYSILGYSHDEVVRIVTSDRWKELGWEILF